MRPIGPRAALRKTLSFLHPSSIRSPVASRRRPHHATRSTRVGPGCPRSRCYASVNAPPSSEKGKQPTQPVRANEAGLNLAVLGGGITGLTTALALSTELPKATVTLYEASARLGGWVDSKTVDVGNGNVVLEQGPRTLRPLTASGYATLKLITALGLEDEVLITPRTAAAAQNRFIYYPDHAVRMPGPGQSLLPMLAALWQEPLFAGLARGLLYEFIQPQRPAELEDESVAAFCARRTGSSALADNLVSAVLHGIYAGDVHQLSAKSLLPGMWALDRRGSIGRHYLLRKSDNVVELDETLMMWASQDQLRPILDRFRHASVYSFKGGLGTLTGAVEKTLRRQKNVRVRTETPVKKLRHDGASGEVHISLATNHPPARHTHVFSTLSGPTLASISEAPLPSLANIPAVTVMVVNVYYANSMLLPIHGFGYLIPRSIPWEQNPERALGVVFDSDAVVGQDSAPGTKVTVMLGGHWWDGWSTYPDEDEAVVMAKRVLARHLHITAEPVVVHVGLQRDCIPQYTVGHHARLTQADRALRAAYRGRPMPSPGRKTS
ncbi:MAG: oxygen-dependent protoporphyrinogen oxidase [Thelocarpon superellum]|nr:MAG: oxygen-dependent protoporphyrinogen oxidase [Thelocarpon superellum]